MDKKTSHVYFIGVPPLYLYHTTQTNKKIDKCPV